MYSAEKGKFFRIFHLIQFEIENKLWALLLTDSCELKRLKPLAMKCTKRITQTSVGLQNFSQPSKFNLMLFRELVLSDLLDMSNASYPNDPFQEWRVLLIPSSVSNTFKIICTWLQSSHFSKPYLRQLPMAVPRFFVALLLNILVYSLIWTPHGNIIYSLYLSKSQ